MYMFIYLSIMYVFIYLYICLYLSIMYVFIYLYIMYVFIYIYIASQYPQLKLKLNCVVVNGLNNTDMISLIQYMNDINKSKENITSACADGKLQPMDLRFIEYMPFDSNAWKTEALITYHQMIDYCKSHSIRLVPWFKLSKGVTMRKIEETASNSNGSVDSASVNGIQSFIPIRETYEVTNNTSILSPPLTHPLTPPLTLHFSPRDEEDKSDTTKWYVQLKPTTVSNSHTPDTLPGRIGFITSMSK